MRKRERVFLASVFFIFMGIILWAITQSKNDLIVLPLPDEKAYTEKVNQWLIKKKQAHDIARVSKTAEKQAKEEAFWTNLVSNAHAAISDIRFYGKIVDQYGNPVSGVLVKYKARSQYLSAGTGFGETISDKEGRFNTAGAEGVGLSILEFIKPGYQFPGIHDFDNFQRFKDSVLWKDFTKDKPYIFNAWKIERYPKVNANIKGAVFSFESNTVYSMDFTSPSVKRVKQKDSVDLDLRVLIHRDDSGWKVKLTVPDGGLIETDDQYLNLAPESGYQKEIIYSGSEKEYFELEKKYYLHSRGNMYGSLIAIIWPYYRDISAIKFHYVMNLENGRDLAVKQ